MWCYKFKTESYKNNLCKRCYIKIHGECKKCGIESQTKLSVLCHKCILDYLDIDEIFKDDFINERKIDLIKSYYSNCKCLLIISFFLMTINIGMLLFAIITNDVDDFFVFLIFGLCLLTFFSFRKYIKSKKNIPSKEKSALKDILLSYSGSLQQIDKIITFGERALYEYDYNGDPYEMTDNDILYLSKKENISFLEAKAYIKYYLRILNEIDDINEQISYENACEKELEDYYYAQEQYNYSVNLNNRSDIMLCNQYFEKMEFEELGGMIPSKEYLPYKNIELYLRLSMPKITLLNHSQNINGAIKVILIENEEIVAEGYIEGEFYDGATYKIICKTIKNIKNLDNIKYKFEVGALWFD